MKKKLTLLVISLLFLVFASYAYSEYYWQKKGNNSTNYLQATGLSSIAIGNLSPISRSPGYELLCTGLYDVPGGYCSYFTEGVPFINYHSGLNITLERRLN